MCKNLTKRRPGRIADPDWLINHQCDHKRPEDRERVWFLASATMVKVQNASKCKWLKSKMLVPQACRIDGPEFVGKRLTSMFWASASEGLMQEITIYNSSATALTDFIPMVPWPSNLSLQAANVKSNIFELPHWRKQWWPDVWVPNKLVNEGPEDLGCFDGKGSEKCSEYWSSCGSSDVKCFFRTVALPSSDALKSPTQHAKTFCKRHECILFVVVHICLHFIPGCCREGMDWQDANLLRYMAQPQGNC